MNNDGELAIDISESDEMEELLQKEIDSAGIDCEARNMKLKANQKCAPHSYVCPTKVTKCAIDFLSSKSFG